MKNFKSLTIWTIVLSFLIVVSIMHTVSLFGIFEVYTIFDLKRIGDDDFSLSLNAFHEQLMVAASIFTFIGQIFLFVSTYTEKQWIVFRMKITGILFLWLGFFYLIYHFNDDDQARLSMFCGLPFLIASIILFYKIIKYRSSKFSDATIF
jgi:hypothetical protein